MLIHQYDQIGRDITWATLEHDLATWHAKLAVSFPQAEATLAAETNIPPGSTGF